MINRVNKRTVVEEIVTSTPTSTTCCCKTRDRRGHQPLFSVHTSSKHTVNVNAFEHAM